jgi:hypothetical protein
MTDRREEGFCTNSNRWITFMPIPPDTCPYDWTDCGPKCGYYEMREPSRWFRYKLAILKGYKEINP